MIYNCFTTKKVESYGNPSSVFIGEFSKTQMSELAIKANTPISCFVKILTGDNSAKVTFFAQNGEEDGFCAHGLLSVTRHLKDKGLNYINTLITASGFPVKTKVLEDNLSILEIGVSKFNTSSYRVKDFAEIFKLPQDDIAQIFQTGPLKDIVIECASPEALKNITMEADTLDSFTKKHNMRIMIFFCKNSSFDFADVEIRVFCSKLTHLEDIVCGSANISVSKILYSKYDITSYRVVQPFNYKDTGKIGGYQEVEYNDHNQTLILKGSTTKDKFIFETLDIEFDNKYNPIEKNEDYYLLKEIFTDPEVMKTSTVFACQTPETEKELHFLMYSMIEKNKRYKKYYGLQKIFHISSNEYIGAIGLLRSDNNTVEGVILLKSKYIGSGLGFWVEKKLFENLEKLDKTMIASVWDGNSASSKLMKKNGMKFFKVMNKTYKNNTIKVELYIKPNRQLTQLIENNEATDDSNIIELEDYLLTNKLTKAA